jgi:hypothetical protein
MNFWETIFRQSPVNDGYYDEQSLPQSRWDWPSGTWFQTRLDRIREREPISGVRAVRKMRGTDDLRTM